MMNGMMGNGMMGNGMMGGRPPGILSAATFLGHKCDPGPSRRRGGQRQTERNYLDTVVNKDGPAFADGNFSALPSAEASHTLQNSVHQVASGHGNTDPVASGMVSAAASLTAAQSKVTA